MENFHRLLLVPVLIAWQRHDSAPRHCLRVP